MKEVLTFRDRQNTNCEKWDGLSDQFGQSDLLPLWVADMDFEAPLCVQEALAAYLKRQYTDTIIRRKNILNPL